jgi:hypothetical protein
VIGWPVGLARSRCRTRQERSADEFEQLLSSAGFTLDRIVATPSPFSFIEATLHA